MFVLKGKFNDIKEEFEVFKDKILGNVQLNKEFKQWIKSEVSKEFKLKGFNNSYSHLAIVNRGLFKHILFTAKNIPSFIKFIIKEFQIKKDIGLRLIALIFAILFFPLSIIIIATESYYFSLRFCKRKFECLIQQDQSQMEQKVSQKQQ